MNSSAISHGGPERSRQAAVTDDDSLMCTYSDLIEIPDTFLIRCFGPDYFYSVKGVLVFPMDDDDDDAWNDRLLKLKTLKRLEWVVIFNVDSPALQSDGKMSWASLLRHQ